MNPPHAEKGLLHKRRRFFYHKEHRMFVDEPFLLRIESESATIPATNSPQFFRLRGP